MVKHLSSKLTKGGEKMAKDSSKTVSYLRVSTSQQDTEKNKTAVRAFANSHDFGRVEFVEEAVSGRVSWKERKIKNLIDSLNEGDRLIVPELSRLGRSILEIMEMLSGEITIISLNPKIPPTAPGIFFSLAIIRSLQRL